jgi:predicted CoA-binding protein
MTKLPSQVAKFLSYKRIAVVGVSRDSAQPANAVFRRLTDCGYSVFAINPNAAQVENGPCYPNIRSLPESVEGIVIATHPNVSAQIVRECAEAGIRHLWFHRSFGEGSVSVDAVRECEQRGIECIVGGCPMMYCGRVDFGHRCMRWILKIQNRIPR